MNDHIYDEIPSLLLGDASRDVVLGASSHLRSCPDCQQDLASAVIAHASLTSARRFATETVAVRSAMETVQPTATNANEPLPDLSATFAQARRGFGTRSRGGRMRARYLLAGAAAVVAAAGAVAIIESSSGPDATPVATRTIQLAAYDAGTVPATARIEGGQLKIDATALPHLMGRRYEVWLTDRTRTHLQPVGWIGAGGRTRLDVPADLMSRFNSVEVSVQKLNAASYGYSGTSVLRGSYR